LFPRFYYEPNHFPLRRTHLENINRHSIKELMSHHDRKYIIGYSLASSPLHL
jgi:hypothetical protein